MLECIIRDGVVVKEHILFFCGEFSINLVDLCLVDFVLSSKVKNVIDSS